MGLLQAYQSQSDSSPSLRGVGLPAGEDAGGRVAKRKDTTRCFTGRRPRSGRALWSAVYLALAVPLLSVSSAHAAGDQAKEVKLHKDFTTDPASELPDLHIDDGEIAAKVKKLLEKEAKLARIEENVAADLTRKPSKAGREEQQSQWENLWGLYQIDLAEISDAAGQLVGFAMDEAPAVMNLYWFGTRVSREIDETVSKRHALENEYFERLLGRQAGPDDKTPAKTFFDSGQKDRILLTLRERIDAVRRLRQERIDSFLLTRRAVDRTALPTATIERANDLWASDVAELERLERELKAARSDLRELMADKETKLALVRHAKSLIEKCKLPEEEARKKALEGRLKRLQVQLAKADEALKAQDQKILDLNQAIQKEKLGYDSQKGGVREEAWTREKIDELGAAISSSYAELAIRRRIMKRTTREAVHNYKLADKLSQFRRMELTKEQREAIIQKAENYSAADLRGAYIDQGIVSLCRRERGDEEAFMKQLDYALRMVSAAKKFGVEIVRKRFDDLVNLAKEFDDPALTDEEEYERKMAQLQKDLRFFVDEVETLKEVGGGAFSVFIENAKSLLVVTGLYEARLEVEKTHEKIRDKREDTQDQIDLLDEGRLLGDGAVAAHFGIKHLDSPWTYDEFRKKPATRSLRLFHGDKAFHDTLDGGLRRIASAHNVTRLDRAVAEYLIAYEKACFTLRELTRTQNEYHGLDPDSGEFSFKIFLSPVRAIVCAGRAAYRWLDPVYGPHETEIEQWVQKRTGQLDGMRLTFQQLKRADFRWPFILEASRRTKHSWHLELLWEHPEYRRFWHRLRQENFSDKQSKLTTAYRQREDWFPKQIAREKLELLQESVPSPAFLAPAHLQDGLDLVQLYNYPAALQSLIQANKLDPDVISTDQINRAEKMMAWWETGEKWGRLATEIADQCVWYVISQGIMNNVVGSVRTGLASYLKVPLPTVPAQSMAQQFGNILKGYFNPLRNIVSYETYTQQGFAAAFQRLAKETTYELVEDSFKEEVMLRQLRMDPAVADRLAGMMFNLLTESLEASVEVTTDAAGRQIPKIKESETYQRLISSTLLYRCAKLANRAETKPAADPAKAVEDTESVEVWKEQRAIAKQAELKQIDEALKKLTEEGTKKATEDGKKTKEGDEETLESRRKKLTDEEVETERQWLNRRKRLLTEPIDPENLKAILDELPVDFERAKQMLEGTLSEADHQKAVDESVELIRLFQDSIKEIESVLKSEHKGKGGPEMLKQFKEKLDIARQVVHRESFNHAARVIKSGSPAEVAKLLKDAGLEGKIEPQRMREMFDMILAIVPTGSAGYLGRVGKGDGGEYKPFDSDLDFTVLLREIEGMLPAQSDERPHLEKLLAHSLKEVGKGVNDIQKLFDVAYMADDAPKFAGAALDRQGFGKIMEEVERVKNSTEFETEADRMKALDKLLEQFEGAYQIAKDDLAHPERYRLDGRLRMLWYLTALGDHILVAEGGKFVKKMKKDSASLTDEGQRELAESKNAKLEDWMGWEIILDDLVFLGKHLAEMRPDGIPAAMHALGDKPSAKELKEAGKRNIRELVGHCCDDPVLLEVINKLLDYPGQDKYADHETFCQEIAKEMKARGADTDPPLKDILKHIELMGKYKNDPDPDQWVENATGARRKGADDTKVLAKGMEDHLALATRMAKSAFKGIEKHMGEVFTSKQQKAESVAKAQKKVAELEAQLSRAPPDKKQAAQTKLDAAQTSLRVAETELKIVEAHLSKKLITALAGFKAFGDHLPKPMRPDGQPNFLQRDLLDAFRKAGASESDILEAFATIGIKSDYESLIAQVFAAPKEGRPIDVNTRRRFPDEEEPPEEGEEGTTEEGTQDGDEDDDEGEDETEGGAPEGGSIWRPGSGRSVVWRPGVPVDAPMSVRRAA